MANFEDRREELTVCIVGEVEKFLKLKNVWDFEQLCDVNAPHCDCKKSGTPRKGHNYGGLLGQQGFAKGYE
ncbi:hypothetical protein SLA2020_484360 [Shorea laevis]